MFQRLTPIAVVLPYILVMFIIVSVPVKRWRLAVHGDGPDLLFLFQSDQPLSRLVLTSRLREILATAGVPGNFFSHSFRIGAFKSWVVGLATVICSISGLQLRLWQVYCLSSLVARPVGLTTSSSFDPL